MSKNPPPFPIPILSDQEPNSSLSTDYTNRCGNCHEYLQKGDKYCRYCGTKRGKGEFQPYQNVIQCIYGPMPIERTHKCTKCRRQWTTMLMLDNQDYCPRCGARSEIIQEGDHRISR